MCKGIAVRQSRKMVNEDHIAIKLVVLWGNPFHHTISCSFTCINSVDNTLPS
jgi:hypothetical protein